MSNTLIKLQRYEIESPEPAPLPPAVTRSYLQETKHPLTKSVRVATAAEADYSVEIDEYVPYRGPSGSVSYTHIVYKAHYKRVSAGYHTVLTPVTETIPAIPVPPAPAIITPVPSAWNATAWSVLALEGAVQATFATSAGVKGVLAGLAVDEPTPETVTSHIVHGFKVENGYAYAVVSPPAGVQATAEYLAFSTPVNEGSLFRVLRTVGEVLYYIDEVLVARSGDYLGDAPVHLAGALYAVGDEITSPTLEAVEQAASVDVVLRLGVRASDADYCEAHVALPLAVRAVERANGADLRLWVRAGDMPEAEVNVGFGLRASGFGYAGTVGGASVSFGPMSVLAADHDYSFAAVNLFLQAFGDDGDYPAELVTFSQARTDWAEGLATFPHRGLYTTAVADVGFEVSVSPSVRLDTRSKVHTQMRGSLTWMLDLATKARSDVQWQAVRLVDVVLVATGEGGAQLSGILLVTADFDTTARAEVELEHRNMVGASFDTTALTHTDFATRQILEAALHAVSYAGVTMGEPGKNLAVWSVNASNNASAAYEDYPFNSFATIGGRHYGASLQGICELEGPDDAGTPIQASIHLGKRNFGSPAIKGITYAYLGVSSDNRMVVRVTVPTGESYLYQTRRADAYQATQRADFGRGLRAHYLELEVYNADGSDFSLHNLEFDVHELKRRI